MTDPAQPDAPRYVVVTAWTTEASLTQGYDHDRYHSGPYDTHDTHDQAWTAAKAASWDLLGEDSPDGTEWCIGIGPALHVPRYGTPHLREDGDPLYHLDGDDLMWATSVPEHRL